MPYTAYIVDFARTAGGKKKGALSEYHPVDLGALTLDALVEKTGINGADISDVILGCVSQVGSQSANVARNVVLASKHVPLEVPGTTVDRQCGSSQQALHFAAQAVMSGAMNVCVAGGVEVMSKVPIGANIMDGLKAGHGLPFDASGIAENFPGQPLGSQFEGAELLAKKYNLTRDELENLAVLSHKRAVEATEKGYFDEEICPIKGKDGSMHTKDEGIRPSTTLEGLKKLKPLKKDGGIITAATSSQICDGASMMLVVNELGLKQLGLKPKAKIVGMGLAGSDPLIMLEGPIPASRNCFKNASLTMEDMDLVEVNEAFAPVPLSLAKALNCPIDKLNVNGGAMALGHALGSTGTRCASTLIAELNRRGDRYGLLAICEGGGTANATIFEALGTPDSKL